MTFNNQSPKKEDDLTGRPKKLDTVFRDLYGPDRNFRKLNACKQIWLLHDQTYDHFFDLFLSRKITLTELVNKLLILHRLYCKAQYRVLGHSYYLIMGEGHNWEEAPAFVELDIMQEEYPCDEAGYYIGNDAGGLHGLA